MGKVVNKNMPRVSPPVCVTYVVTSTMKGVSRARVVLDLSVLSQSVVYLTPFAEPWVCCSVDLYALQVMLYV